MWKFYDLLMTQKNNQNHKVPHFMILYIYIYSQKLQPKLYYKVIIKCFLEKY